METTNFRTVEELNLDVNAPAVTPNDKSSMLLKIFLSQGGIGLSTQRAWQIVKEIAVLAGLEANVYPHLFRHSFATHLLANGADLRIIQELLGHADISTTQVYTHVDISQLKATVTRCHPRAHERTN
jgi:integrase/recombinase XerD